MFERAINESKKYKLLLWGGPGCFKTRTMLALGHNPDGPSKLAVVDTEFGTDHYAKEFKFNRIQAIDPDVVSHEIDDLIKDPGDFTTIGFDTISVWYEAVASKFTDLYMIREPASKGHKKEYYVLQPRDYTPINRYANKQIRMLLKSDLNVIGICQSKDKWDDMQVVGVQADGPKRLAHFFDTIIEISEGKKGFIGHVRKDRSNTFKIGTQIPWMSEKEIVKAMAGMDFLTGVAKPMVINSEDIDFDDKVDLLGQVHDLKKGMSQEKYLEILLTFGVKSANDLGVNDVRALIEKMKVPDLVEELTDQVNNFLGIHFPDKQVEVKEFDKAADIVFEEKVKELVDEAKKTDDAIEAKLVEITKLKAELHISDRKVWTDLLEPFKVSSAKEMTDAQLDEFIFRLKAMRPTQAQST